MTDEELKSAGFSCPCLEKPYFNIGAANFHGLKSTEFSCPCTRFKEMNLKLH